MMKFRTFKYIYFKCKYFEVHFTGASVHHVYFFKAQQKVKT